MAKRRTQILDELLLLRCQQGSSEAFELLVNRWQAPLWHHAYRLTGAQDAAWDVFQEVWMAISRGIARLQDPVAFRRWAYTIVSRKAADWARRRSAHRGEGPLTEESAADGPPADDPGSENGAAAALRQALLRLSGERRALINLHYVEGFRQGEVASLYGVTESRVNQIVNQAGREARA